MEDETPAEETPVEMQWDLECCFYKNLIDDPCIADDGKLYSRRGFLAWAASRKSDGLPLVSPRDGETIVGETLHDAPDEVVRHLKDCHADERSLAKKRKPPFKSLDGMRAVFESLDPLTGLLKETLNGWQTPRVVVFGDESSGKSSLLERLAMIPILPRGEDICTRLPIELKLRHVKKEDAKLPVLIVRDSATGKVEVHRTVDLENGQVDVRTEMEKIVQREHQGLTSISTTRTIEIHIQSPTVPSIDLVDLPGLRLSAGAEDDEDTPEKIRALVKQQIQQHADSAIYLVTCKASTNPLQAHGFQLVSELELQDRAIGRRIGLPRILLFEQRHPVGHLKSAQA